MPNVCRDFHGGVLCEECSVPFFPESSYVYFEPQRELLAFVFPESYRAKETYWREKMRDDFLTMKKSLGASISLATEPDIYFGQEELAQVLESEDYRSEEREVMEAVAAELKLSLYCVSPSFARREKVPASLPYEGTQATPKSIIAGLEKLLTANDRLGEFKAYLKRLKTETRAALPPKSAPATPS